MVLKMGPSGGISGENWNETPTPADPRLVLINVYWRDVIVGMDLYYVGENEFYYGGTDRSPEEYTQVGFQNNKRLSKIVGYSGWWNGYTAIMSILFAFTDGSDSGWIGAFGSKPPLFTNPVSPFEYDVPLGMGLVGLFGNTGAVMDQIGFKFDNLPS